MSSTNYNNYNSLYPHPRAKEVFRDKCVQFDPQPLTDLFAQMATVDEIEKTNALLEKLIEKMDKVAGVVGAVKTNTEILRMRTEGGQGRK